MKRLNGKLRGAAWFVSHCSTNSKREKYVEQLQEHFPVDVYGSCGTLKCPRGGACENMLDEQYHFYIAFENSICKDYITEKLWNQGYGRDIVPIVMKRAVVEQLVPPKSFIAADDFNTTKELATYLHYLMRNKSAYAEYFEWRRDYKVVFLDGSHHDTLERPWGFCQICRLLWEQPRPIFSIPNFNDWWDKSCENDGELTERLLGKTVTQLVYFRCTFEIQLMVTHIRGYNGTFDRRQELAEYDFQTLLSS
ncbi:fucosyl transferase [Ancylostoma caninum]|uniref:Fucosyltransferase n=1 Tax=Ancylostoma caninum TaxID=29170 RepID=A0A368GRQ3_ANCCA|nr:fucosyl transferase [Ancylostoma caninum]